MIEITYFIKNKNGQWVEGGNAFDDAYKAVRFVHMIRAKGARCIDYSCYDPEDCQVLERAC